MMTRSITNAPRYSLTLSFRGLCSRFNTVNDGTPAPVSASSVLLTNDGNANTWGAINVSVRVFRREVKTSKDNFLPLATMIKTITM